MKLPLTLILLSLSLLSCKEKKHDENVNQPTLKEQMESLRAMNNGDVGNHLDNRSAEFKESLARKIFEKLDEASLAKLMSEPRFKELLKKSALSAQSEMSKLMDDLHQTEVRIFKPMKVSVIQKLALDTRQGWADPILRYAVHTESKDLSCEQVQEAGSYWDDLLAIQQSESLLLGANQKLFEQSLKSCLLFYRLKESLQKCEDPRIEALSLLCQGQTFKVSKVPTPSETHEP